MSNRLAQVISYILHPAIFPLVAMLVILKGLAYNYSFKIVVYVISIVFVGTYLLPLLFAFLLLKLGKLQSLHMKDASDRKLPYFIGALCYYFTAQSIRNIHIAPEAFLFLTASALVVVIHLSLLFFFKPSAHMGAVGGFIGLLLALSLNYHVDMLWPISITILLSGFVGSARYALQAHTFLELGVGYLSGILIVFLACYNFMA